MRNYCAFLQKEWMEFFRNKRFLGLAAVFLMFAFSSPILARFMLEFLAMLVPGEEMFQMLLPEPAWTDSYAQFYGNIEQIGSITMILLFMGIISSEKQRGTADLMFTKGLSRMSFVLSKFTVLAISVLITTMISVLIVFAYTFLLFDTAGNFPHVLLGGFVFFLFLLFLLALIILCSTFAKTNVSAALFAFLGFLGAVFISSIPRIGTYLPGRLLAYSRMITFGETPEGLLICILVTLLLTAATLYLAVCLLRRQEGQ